jgi:hypothetical protein
MDEFGKGQELSRKGNRIAARYREDRRRIDRLVREAEQASPEATQRRELIRAATRTGRAPVKAREAADLRLVAALNRLLDAGLSIREVSGKVGIGYHQGRQLLRPSPPEG